jgi:hypothetical protein
MLALSACEKPAPKVTIATGGRVINVDATRYCHDECVDHKTAAKTIRVRSDSFISFDVPKEVAEKGWNIQIGGQNMFRAPRNKSHYLLAIPTIGGDSDVPVVVTQNGEGGQPGGVWQLQLDIRE